MDYSKRSSAIAFFLSINLVLFSIASGCNTCSQPHPIKTPKPITNPIPRASSGSGGAKSCPRDTLKLGVCAKLLNGAVGAVVGSPPDTPCCAVLEGLLDLEVAVCLCTAIKANILGINLNFPVSLSLLLDGCAKKYPPGFQCA